VPDIVLAAVFAAAVLTGAAVTALFLPSLRRLAGKQHVREDVPETHLEKAGTPSMGGLCMLGAAYLVVLVAGALVGQLTARLLLCLGTSLAFALIGLADDVQKLGDRKSRGIPARYRILLELLVAGGLFYALRWVAPDASEAPRWIGTGGWDVLPALGIALFTVAGGANAFNLTDGLDGLASGLSLVAGVAMAIVAVGVGADDLAVWATVVAGAAGGFLFLNAKPAKVWMGDVGSLGLGAALCSMAVAARAEFLFGIIAAVFVAEALSVILQVISFQTTGKRIFRMAPIHHHFELKGLKETQVVGWFWAVGVLAAVLALGAFWLIMVGQ